MVRACVPANPADVQSSDPPGSPLVPCLRCYAKTGYAVRELVHESNQRDCDRALYSPKHTLPLMAPYQPPMAKYLASHGTMLALNGTVLASVASHDICNGTILASGPWHHDGQQQLMMPWLLWQKGAAVLILALVCFLFVQSALVALSLLCSQCSPGCRTAVGVPSGTGNLARSPIFSVTSC